MPKAEHNWHLKIKFYIIFLCRRTFAIVARKMTRIPKLSNSRIERRICTVSRPLKIMNESSPCTQGEVVCKTRNFDHFFHLFICTLKQRTFSHQGRFTVIAAAQWCKFKILVENLESFTFWNFSVKTQTLLLVIVISIFGRENSNYAISFDMKILK